VTGGFILRGRVPVRSVDLRLLRRILRTLLEELLKLEVVDLGIYIVEAAEMVRLNETFLRHRGSTDVLAFDYAEPLKHGSLTGEIFVCLDEAQSQARRFRVTWQIELVRYIVHGVLHLCGYDDKRPSKRARLKREENRLLRELELRFELAELASS